MSRAPDDRATRRLLRRVGDALIEALGEGGGRELIVALSGGPDSSALLLALAEGRERTGWQPHAVHVDHRISNAQERRAFREAAARAAALAQVPLDISFADAPARARERRIGIEAAAREVRYEALAAAARELGATVVAVAHTRNDQAETMLLHIVRGAQLDGLAGMRPLAPLPYAEGEPPLRLVRPALDLTRDETRAICAAWGFEPAEDPANEDLERLRNRLRHRLLPQLRELNPQLDAALARLAEGVAADRAFLDQAAAAALDGLTTRDEDGDAEGAWPRAELGALHPALRRRVLRLIAAGAGLELSAERTAAAERLLERDSGEVQLGAGVSLRLRRGRLALVRRAP